MSYVKYREDDIKISDDRRHMHSGSELAGGAREPLKYYDCKYCRAVFEERGRLYRHIRQKHNIVRPLVLINGKIAGDSCLIERLDSAFLDLYGFREPITVNGYTVSLEAIDENDEIDITDRLRDALRGNPQCRIAFPSASIEIRLISFSIPKSPFVAETIQQWERDISLGRKLAIPDYGRQEDEIRLFLDGMYNYYVAASAKNDKARRYDDALDILSRFHELSGMGKCVLKIIAYRRNWVSSLDMLTADEMDIFSAASDYYHRRPSNLALLPSDDFVREIYIEDATKKSLNLVFLFQQKEYELIRKQLARMSDIEDLGDPNLTDQYYLLLARLAEQELDHQKADIYYGKLMAPAFREEYEQYKNRLARLSKENGD